MSLSDLSEGLQNSVDSVVNHFGPLLAQALIYNVGGNAARSELDKISDPIKKLVARQVRAKSWLESALVADSFPSGKVTSSDKKVFLQKLIK